MRFERLSWLTPLAYVAHIAEEYAAGFPAWMRAVLGQAMDARSFLFANALFLAVLLGLCLSESKARSRLSAILLMVWASGNLFWNFAFHLVTTVAFARYSPGLVTAALLYAPLSLLVAAASLREGRLSVAQLTGAIVLGGVLTPGVVWVGRALATL